MLLSDYLKLGNKLDENGIFDPVLDQDSNFFINLQRLKTTTVPEFRSSYSKIHDYFRKLVKLLDCANQKSTSDNFYKQALRMFKFSEVNGICLGYAKGTIGSGFGAGLASQVMSTAYDIVKTGVKDPEIFELMPLFQENVGADRLSDMIATLILGDIQNYTQRVNSGLRINQKRYEKLCFNDGFLVNPYKHDDVLLVPVDILHKLPVAESWEDIDLVVSENSVIRAEMNAEVASEWKKYKSDKRKQYLQRAIFKDPEACRRVVDGYRREELGEFDPNDNIEYYLAKLEQMFEHANINWKTKVKAKTPYECAIGFLGMFKHWVEYNKGWEEIHLGDSRKREKGIQRLIHLTSESYIDANHLDISCEPDEGRGPADFKVSLGQDKVIIEVKLTSNNQYLHGYEVQLEEYAKAEQTDKMIYVLVDLGNPSKVKKVQDLHDRKVDEGCKAPELIVIDARKQESASIA